MAPANGPEFGKYYPTNMKRTTLPQNFMTNCWYVVSLNVVSLNQYRDHTHYSSRLPAIISPTLVIIIDSTVHAATGVMYVLIIKRSLRMQVGGISDHSPERVHSRVTTPIRVKPSLHWWTDCEPTVFAVTKTRPFTRDREGHSITGVYDCMGDKQTVKVTMI